MKYIYIIHFFIGTYNNNNNNNIKNNNDKTVTITVVAASSARTIATKISKWTFFLCYFL